MQESVAALLEAVDEARGSLLLAVTGAGASHASGIPTFRGSDPEAVWRQSDISLATFDYFSRDPVGQWSWYLKRFEAVAAARPNAAHRALVGLEDWQREQGGEFLLVTQNIDTLHEQAGSRGLIKVHGTSDRVRCSRTGCAHGAPSGSLPVDAAAFDRFRREPIRENLPLCPGCGALLRAHVLFFDEFYGEHLDYRFDEVEEAARRARVVLFVGTSFSVGVTDLILRAGTGRGAALFSVDPAARGSSWPGLAALPERAEELLPALVAALAPGV